MSVAPVLHNFRSIVEAKIEAWTLTREVPAYSGVAQPPPKTVGQRLLGNAVLKHGNKNDHIDARKLASLLRLDELEPVYHGQRVLNLIKIQGTGSRTPGPLLFRMRYHDFRGGPEHFRGQPTKEHV